MPLTYPYGEGAYGVGQYATFVFAVSSTTAVVSAVGEIVRLGAASVASSSAASGAGLVVMAGSASVATSSATGAAALRVVEGGADAEALSGVNEVSGEFIVAATFDPAESTTESAGEGLRIGTGGATVATVSVGAIVAERIHQPAANATSFSGRVARGNYRARGQAFSQTTASASASTGRILWGYFAVPAAAWNDEAAGHDNWQTVGESGAPGWLSVGANGQPLAA